MSGDEPGNEPLKSGESFRTRLTPEQVRARAASVHAKVQRATAVAEQSAGGSFPGSTAFTIGVLCLLGSGALNIVSQTMGIYLGASDGVPSTAARFMGLLVGEMATVLFYCGLAPLLAGAIRYGLAREAKTALE